MRPFEINFDFPVASSNLKISLYATAEMHHSEPYFVVHDFYVASNRKHDGLHPVLPVQEVKYIVAVPGYGSIWIRNTNQN